MVQRPELEIAVNVDCSGAPKKQLLRDLNIAFARADVEKILAFMSDDIRWQIVGEANLLGKDAVRAALQAMSDVHTSHLCIESIITDRQDAAVNGIITSANGRKFAFCDICEFAHAGDEQIKSLKSYTLELPRGS